MVDYGIVKPSNKILERGTPTVITSHNIETATTMYAGRLVKAGTTDYDIVVNDGVSPVIGWLGWEQADMNNRPATVDTIYAASEEAPVLRGGDFNIVGSLAVGFVAVRGDYLIPWGSGQLAPATLFPEGWGVKIGFIQKSSAEFSTGVILPTGIMVYDVKVYVSTNVSSGTIDIGIGKGTEAGFDADGFLDGESTATAGWVNHNLVDASAANITIGELLEEVEIKDATETPVYLPIKCFYVCDGTCKTISYTTSAHASIGNFYVILGSPGTFPVAIAEQPIDASAAAADIVVRSLI